MANVAELVETVKNMTVLELNEFVKALQEEFGVSAMPVAAAAVAAPAAAADAGAAEAEE
ncbi:MAG: 50S ribosomal protein L7/L12, partial [Armatimonadota bacterium]